MNETCEVGGETYSLLLHALCESAQARRVLEIGTGWGYSTAAFCRSMAARRGSTMTTVDPVDRIRTDNMAAIKLSGVDCRFQHVTSDKVTVSGEFDIVYIDGDPSKAADDFNRFIEYVRPGGFIVLDGYGGQSGPTDAVDSLSARYVFTTLPYHHVYSFAVYRRPLAPLGDGRFAAQCDQCPASASLPSWAAIDNWADMHVSKVLHTVTVVVEPRHLKYCKGPR